MSFFLTVSLYTFYFPVHFGLFDSGNLSREIINCHHLCDRANCFLHALFFFSPVHCVVLHVILSYVIGENVNIISNTL